MAYVKCALTRSRRKCIHTLILTWDILYIKMMMLIKPSIFNLLFSLLITTTISISSSSSTLMAEAAPSSSPANVYIVYTEQPTDGPDHESFHLRTLSSALGSEEAAKGSLIYVYKNAATGFSAKLTPEQVSELKKQPGVIQVVVSQPIDLHSPVQ